MPQASSISCLIVDDQQTIRSLVRTGLQNLGINEVQEMCIRDSLKSAGPLLTSLREARGQDVALEAGEVRRVGGQCLQVLIAARTAWAAEGRCV